MNFSVFYSWQSHVGGHANCGYIRDKIKAAFSEIGVELNLLEDSRGSAGAPDIPDAILSKIAKSDIFICDVTSVCTLNLGEGMQRGIPNPNVMFELGFAVRQLGWERIICVLNDEYGNVESLPFDISKHRIIRYKKKDRERKSVQALSLTLPLSDIVKNFDDIISKGNEFDYKKHDIAIFKKLMSFTTERDFINGISDFKSSGRFFKWYEKCWDYIKSFQDYPENRFINQSLNDSFIQLSSALDDLTTLTCRICHVHNTKNWEFEKPDVEYTPEQIHDILMTQEYRKRNIPYPDNGDDAAVRKYYETIDEDERDIAKYSNNILEAYKNFRDNIKRILVI